jgi:thiamine-phosphate diphosphorylase
VPEEPVVLTLVTPGRGGDLAGLAREAQDAGIDHFQIREKQLHDHALLEQVGGVVGSVAGGPMKVIVNGRPDVATLGGADGVQLPEAGLPVGTVRATFPRLLVGASRHSAQAAARAEEEGAHWVCLGPIFATPGKEERVLGPAVLREVSRALRVPVFAIGGIDGASAPTALAAGARGLMAIRFFGERPLARAVAALRGRP